mgnify:CR=1 FL=1
MPGIFWEGDIEDNYLGHIFAEVFKDKVYLPLLPANKENTIAIDVGANLGIVSLYFSKYFEKVIALEPALEHYTNLTNMLSFNKITNVKPIKKALFIETINLPFFHNKNKTMYSLHMAVDDQSSKPEQVETTTLDKLFKEENIGHCDLLKLDVEGSEVEILSGSGFKKVAPKIDNIFIEQHVWSGRHPNQLIEALKNNNFTVENVPNDAQLLIARKIT